MKKILIDPVKWIIDQAPAEQMQVCICFDDLHSGATFQVALFDANGNQVASRNIACTGADYDTWDGNNEFPIQYVASKLNLTIKPQ